MDDLGKALDDIAALRKQMARASEFRGYGPTTLAATGLLALIAAVVQTHILPQPMKDMTLYLALWIGTAFLASILIAIEVVTRSKRAHSGLADAMILQALEQLLPSLGAGLLLTCVLVRFAPQNLPLLPGLWEIFISLGVFASMRSLPRPLLLVAVWYLGCGLASTAYATGENVLSPLAMGVPFGFGQLLAAVILFYLNKQIYHYDK